MTFDPQRAHAQTDFYMKEAMQIIANEEATTSQKTIRVNQNG